MHYVNNNSTLQAGMGHCVVVVATVVELRADSPANADSTDTSRQG
jgi:hypothetical protein